MRADLHIHTTNSDGALSISEVCDVAKRRGLNIIALSDHDIFSDATSIKYDDLRIINGVEVSSMCNGENIHILAYFYDYPPKDFLLFLDNIKNERMTRAEKICDLLKEHFEIDLDRSFINKSNSITRGEIAREIIKQGYNYTKHYIFDHILGDDCPCFIPASHLTCLEVIEKIKSNKGLAVLAHPMIYKEENLKEIIDLGFDGMEVIYPHTESRFSKYNAMARKRGMFITAGSDFHAMSSLDLQRHGNIGDVYLNGHDLDVFLERLYERNK